MSCAHKVCERLDDGECHIDTDGWLVNVTRAQCLRVREMLGIRSDEIGAALFERFDYSRAIVPVLQRVLDGPDGPNRRAAVTMLERFRAAGVPRTPFRDHQEPDLA